APGKIIGTIFLREPLGFEEEILVRTREGTQVKVISASENTFLEGDEVGLEFDRKDLYLFHPESLRTLCYGIDSNTSEKRTTSA
ncbi:MAG: TOBE domain-containing protein, partial [Nitrospinota bacterium]